MNFVYPIKAILAYLAILLAPPGSNLIVLEGFGGQGPAMLVHNGESWTWGGGDPISTEAGAITTIGAGGKETLKVGDFITIPVNHDWSKSPRFALGDGTTLEKSASGFTCKRTTSSGEMNGIYQIRYARSEITINVLGEVKQPGAYPVAVGASLLDAVAAAGGWTEQANLKKAAVIRGPAGEIPKVTNHNLHALLKGDTPSPRLLERDTVYLTDKLF